MIELHSELTELRRAILEMGAAVEQRMFRITDALVRSDLDAARSVRHGDREIDEMEIAIEEECLRILALSHPVAGDLRFVLSVMRINTTLERMADLIKSVAKRALDIAEQTPIAWPRAVEEMVNATQRMVSDALTALSDRNADLAQRVRRADERVDDLQKEVFAWAQSEIPQHVEALEVAIDILSVARKLERVADLSTNIAEDVIFLVGGEVVRHEKLKTRAAS